MKRIISKLIVFSFIGFIPGCATILGGSNCPITLRTIPEGARVEIRNKKGIEVYSGITPVTLKLKPGAGYFAKESYAIYFSRAGYEQKTINLECRINGWYFGNIFIGGILGMLIIDPATGAMYKLDTKDIKENLTLASTSFIDNENFLLSLKRIKHPKIE
jgi:hypothetical protein